MGMLYLTSLNTQLFKNIAYVGSFGHILFNLIFNVNSNLAESRANCSETAAMAAEIDSGHGEKPVYRKMAEYKKKIALVEVGV